MQRVVTTAYLSATAALGVLGIWVTFIGLSLLIFGSPN
jgi:hypothetical protein